MKKIIFFSFIFIISSAVITCGKKVKKDKLTDPKDTIIEKTDIIDTLTSIEFNDSELKKDSSIAKESNIPIVKQVTVKSPQKVTNVSASKTTSSTTPKTTINTTSTTPNNTTTTTNTDTKQVVVENKETTSPKVEEKVIITPKEPVVEVKENTGIVTSPNSWIVPAKDKNMKNPLENTKENLAEGKILYSLHCKSCHGSKGLGDGTKAKGLKGDLGDFSSAAFQSQTDGELFYKTKKGRDDMPGYAKKMSDEEIWLTVIFMRSLKK